MRRGDVAATGLDVKLVGVELGERSYPIYIAPGILSQTGDLIRANLPSAGRCAVVTSGSIHRLHGGALMRSLEEARVEAEPVLVPDGEEAKSWDTAGRLIGELLELGLDRRSVIIAFGGGAVGDLAGFVASIYLRGVSLVQVPTTLLAQVDSAVGGKAAVNHPRGKNLIGSFHQPSLVVADPSLLRTLPRRELLSGLAEVVKYGVIADAELFSLLEAKADEILGRDLRVLTEVVARCCAIKARLVEVDERDTRGLRAALNYGHTVGHALESLTHHGMRHGEAVAVGMAVAARLSERLGIMDADDVERQRRLLRRLGLRTALPRLAVAALLGAMRRDKKAEAGAIRFVLPTGIGKPPILRAVEDDVIILVLEGCGDG